MPARAETSSMCKGARVSFDILETPCGHDPSQQRCLKCPELREEFRVNPEEHGRNRAEWQRVKVMAPTGSTIPQND